MKLKALLGAAAAAILCVSVATAAPPPGKGKHHGRGDDPTQTQPVGHHGNGDGAKPGRGATTTECRGKHLVLAGLYVSGSADATGAGSFAMLVKHTTGNAKRLGLRGKQVTLTVDESTKIRRKGKATVADLVANDRLVVLARACRAAAPTDPNAEPAAPTLLALGVVARPAKAGDGGDTGTTTTGTTTTDTTPTDTVPKTGTGPSFG